MLGRFFHGRVVGVPGGRVATEVYSQVLDGRGALDFEGGQFAERALELAIIGGVVAGGAREGVPLVA